MVVELVVKLILIGDGTVGKTSIRLKYMGFNFNPTYLRTIGADFALKNIKLSDGSTLTAQIWDLAGQIKFNSLRNNYIQGTHSAVIVYDVSNFESYNNVVNWYQMISKTYPSNLPIIIVANKTDLRQQVETLSEEEGESLRTDLARKNGDKKVYYLETSAKTGENVDKLFSIIAEEVIRIYKL